MMSSLDVAANNNNAERNDCVSKDALASTAMPHLMRALESQHNIEAQIGPFLVRYSMRRDRAPQPSTSWTGRPLRATR
jgi:hypothetical protein